MSKRYSVEDSRRTFLLAGSAAAAGAALARSGAAAPVAPRGRSAGPFVFQEPDQDEQPESDITEATIAEAEKLAGVEFTPEEREQLLGGVQRNPQQWAARRAHPLPNGLAPATVFDPRLPGMDFDTRQRLMRRSDADPGPLPSANEDIAFAPVAHLSRWIERGDLTSERLTGIYLNRLKAHGDALECVVTLAEDRAISSARRADAEISAGRYRGPLHGIPWGAKDLLATRGIRTSWGAMPYRDQMIDEDARVVQLLDEAGAVLVAKLTLGALAMGDVWYGGRTNNPFNPRQGSSGSSAGSAAATAAGLVGFGIGTETLGSIVSPCMRCGTTGLRPTFGRVSRAGAMALCWSLDKVGPICRTVEDCALVLSAINGADPGDPSSLDMPFNFDASADPRGMRVGWSRDWFEGRGATDIDRHVLELVRGMGVRMVEMELPEWPYGALMTILNVEAASAFEELTLSNRDDELVRQGRGSWPNSFREAWLVPAVELVQALRFRRDVQHMMAKQFEEIDAIIAPSYAGSLLLITNNTGHPSLTIRAGFRQSRRRGRRQDDQGQQQQQDDTPGPEVPHGITLIGNLFEEGRLCNLGMALERELGVWDRRPALG